ncbi:MAG TPA: VWA domain-containing protein, partial [Terriglobales bacterium]|nr:VWA domain-containing protein [Terriglobales bacterium]
MIRRFIASVLLILFVLAQSGSRISAQETDPHIRVVVNLVQLNVAVTDDKGNYITGLRPQDFAISEDGITQKVATFGEGAESVRRLVDPADANKKPEEPAANAPANNGPEGPQTLGSLVAGANVFILFDTSNYMYRGFVFAQDAIADFVRSLESANRIAFYSYSRDLSRGAPLTSDRTKVLRAVRTTVAGDEAALYN